MLGTKINTSANRTNTVVNRKNRPDKELNFCVVVCWNCKGGCIVDEHTLRPVGFIETDQEKAETKENRKLWRR